MPALTYSQVETSLGSYKDPSANFRAVLNQVIPRLYSTGIYRDLTIQYQLPIVDGCITLPKDAESVLLFQLNGYASQVRSLWHDFKASGMNGSVDPSLYGLVDAGYHATSRLLTEDVKTLFAVPSAMSTSKAALNFNNITLSIVGTDGEEMFLAAAATAMTVSGTLVPNFNGIYAPVAVFGGLSLYTLNGEEYVDSGIANFQNLEMKTISYDTDISRWTINGPDGVGDYALWIAVQATAQPPSSVTSWGADDTETGTVVVTSGPPVYVFSTPVSSITSIKFTQSSGNSIVDIRTVPDDPDTTIATVGPEATVTRYRRYRIPSATEDTTAHVLVKRAFESLVNDDDLIYISNLAAIKHGLLGLIAEDNADLERAKYHWVEAQKNMEMEMESARGSAIPNIQFDIMGIGSHSTIRAMM
jgi:hypothetical protein